MKSNILKHPGLVYFQPSTFTFKGCFMNFTFFWYRKKLSLSPKFTSKESQLDLLTACPSMTVHSNHVLQNQQTVIWFLKRCRQNSVLTGQGVNTSMFS